MSICTTFYHRSVYYSSAPLCEPHGTCHQDPVKMECIVLFCEESMFVIFDTLKGKGEGSGSVSQETRVTTFCLHRAVGCSGLRAGGVRVECRPGHLLSSLRFYVVIHISCRWATTTFFCVLYNLLLTINPLNAELNPICHLLALLGAHPILHVSRIRVNLPLDQRR